MRARLWKFLDDLGDTFWIRPALLVMLGILLGETLVRIDKGEVLPDWMVNAWLYSGGEAGARTLLGAIASSTIGVASTIFSITIAALSLASSQMGPRLLRNFTRDHGNQLTLGIYLGTFAFTLVVLRTVRGGDDGGFVPHLAVTAAMLLAFLCVGMLVFFVHHVANRINVQTVIDLVHDDLEASIRKLTLEERPPPLPDEALWTHGISVVDGRSGYLQQLAADDLADWAAERQVAIRLLLRPGDFVYPGAVIAVVAPPAEDADEAVVSATALGPHPVRSMSLEFAVDQLVEVAVRALSPGINDPNTAMSVLERLGGALCTLVPRHLANGVLLRDGEVRLVHGATDYAGLTDGMFHMIRQNAAGSPAVLIRMLEVLTEVARCERRPERLAALRRHAGLVLADGLRMVGNESDRGDIARRHRQFHHVVQEGALAGTGAEPRAAEAG
jgi:uncharacterized membrane protein